MGPYRTAEYAAPKPYRLRRALHWFAIITGAIGVAALPAIMVASLLALSSCTAPPVDYAEPAPVATPWCFAVTMRVEGEDRAAVGCADRRALCERARANAITYRRFTKMHRIGACQFQEGM
jgi:hypothetical protein